MIGNVDDKQQIMLLNNRIIELEAENMLLNENNLAFIESVSKWQEKIEKLKPEFNLMKNENAELFDALVEARATVAVLEDNLAKFETENTGLKAKLGKLIPFINRNTPHEYTAIIEGWDGDNMIHGRKHNDPCPGCEREAEINDILSSTSEVLAVVDGWTDKIHHPDDGRSMHQIMINNFSRYKYSNIAFPVTVIVLAKEEKND